jgi:hypothetical protein
MTCRSDKQHHQGSEKIGRLIMTARIDQACALFIEQEIKDGLAAGKKPWTIGKELSKWVEKIFEVTINPKTIASRVTRISSNEEKKSNTSDYIDNSTPEIIDNRHPQGGGCRAGAGRKKVVVELVSNAWRYSQMAISQLDKIKSNDPHRVDALNQVVEYCENRKEKSE